VEVIGWWLVFPPSSWWLVFPPGSTLPLLEHCSASAVQAREPLRAVQAGGGLGEALTHRCGC